MSYHVDLQLGRTASTTPWVTEIDGPDFKVTHAKDPCLAELMLFDATSLRVIQHRGTQRGGAYRDLISDREGAVMRFKRRLAQVRGVLAWTPVERRSLEAFGQYMADIDWPYVRLDTSDFRLPLTAAEEEAFDRDLAFTISSLDLPAIANPERLFGGDGRYTPIWERLLNFCFFPVHRIYAADPAALRANACGSPYYTPNDWAHLLCAYLPRRGELSIPQIQRAKRLLNLSPEQAEHWRLFEAALRSIVVVPSYAMVLPDPKPLDADQKARLSQYLTDHAGPLMVTLSQEQKRVARRLFRAKGFDSVAVQV